MSHGPPLAGKSHRMTSQSRVFYKSIPLDFHFYDVCTLCLPSTFKSVCPWLSAGHLLLGLYHAMLKKDLLTSFSFSPMSRRQREAHGKLYWRVIYILIITFRLATFKPVYNVTLFGYSFFVLWEHQQIFHCIPSFKMYLGTIFATDGFVNFDIGLVNKAPLYDISSLFGLGCFYFGFFCVLFLLFYFSNVF